MGLKCTGLFSKVHAVFGLGSGVGGIVYFAIFSDGFFNIYVIDIFTTY